MYELYVQHMQLLLSTFSHLVFLVEQEIKHVL
jgi:hypothetical protein